MVETRESRTPSSRNDCAQPSGVVGFGGGVALILDNGDFTPIS